MRDVPLAAVAVAIVCVVAGGVAPFALLSCRDRLAARRLSAVREVLRPGMSPGEVRRAVQGRASAVGGDDGCWDESPAGVCWEMRLAVLDQGPRRARQESILTVKFDAHAQLSEVVE